MIIEDRYLQTFDEIHNITTDVRDLSTEDEFLDWVESVLILGYRDGMDSTAEMLDMVIDTTDLPLDKLDKALNLVIDGKTYRDRIHDYWESGTDAEIERVVSTEYHRMFNTAAYSEAQDLGATRKTWNCMGLPTSRDTHKYLDGMTIPMSDAFYTYNGHSAMYPHAFEEPSEDINCLCWLTYSK